MLLCERYYMKKKMSAAALICSLLLFTSCGDMRDFGFSGFYLDTAVTCRVSERNGEITEECREIVERMDSCLSAYDVNSDVYRINCGTAFSENDYPVIADILNGYSDFEALFGKGVTPFCGSLTMLWNVTSDAPSVPNQNEISDALNNIANASDYNGSIPNGALIDFGSGAKGYVCDLILRSAESGGAEEVIFSTGSSALVWSADNRSHSTAVIDPVNDDSDLKISTGNAFISTSGGYERFFEDNGVKYTHIMDISSGYPVETDIASVTVILPCEYGRGLVSDLLSTLIFIGGTERLDEYADICEENYCGFGMVVITESGGIITKGTVNFI